MYEQLPWLMGRHANTSYLDHALQDKASIARALDPSVLLPPAAP